MSMGRYGQIGFHYCKVFLRNLAQKLCYKIIRRFVAWAVRLLYLIQHVNRPGDQFIRLHQDNRLAFRRFFIVLLYR
jgi:hypothetical protein